MTAPANPSATHKPVAGSTGRVTPAPETSRPVGDDKASTPRRHDRTMAPLLAVCGLCGGAGATTLSYLIASSAVGRTRGHVLLCDTGGPSGGLAACAGVQSPRTLVELADHVERGLPLDGGVYALDEAVGTPQAQLRVIAAGPRITDEASTAGLATVLAMARSDGAHALTVVDCGTLQRDADRIALGAASHVAWVLPATRTGARRADRLLAAMRPGQPGRELLVARRDDREPRAALRALRALAERRQAPLVLMPQLGDLREGPRMARTAAQVSLQAIHGVLQR